MRSLIFFSLTALVLCLLGCEDAQKDQSEKNINKTMEQIRQERAELKKEQQRQKEENLHRAMPHLLQKAQERSSFADFSLFKDFDKSIEELNNLQINYLEQEEESIVSKDSIDALKELIRERMKIEYVAMRKQTCKILLRSTTTKPNNSIEPALSEIQCDGIAYDTLELVSTDFITQKNMNFYLKRLEPMRFKQITFRMKKNYRDSDLYNSNITDTTFIKN